MISGQLEPYGLSGVAFPSRIFRRKATGPQPVFGCIFTFLLQFFPASLLLFRGICRYDVVYFYHYLAPGTVINYTFIIIQYLFYLFGVLCHFQHCTGHITTVSWKGRGNQYIQLIKVLYCKLPTNGKQLPAFPLEAMLGTNPGPQRWEARVLPLCHNGPYHYSVTLHTFCILPF